MSTETDEGPPIEMVENPAFKLTKRRPTARGDNLETRNLVNDGSKRPIEMVEKPALSKRRPTAQGDDLEAAKLDEEERIRVIEERIRVIVDERLRELKVERSNSVVDRASSLANGLVQHLLSTSRSHGIHMVFVLRATEVGSTRCARYGSMISSLLILLVQVFVLASIIIESGYISCNHDGDCRAGMYCESYMWPTEVGSTRCARYGSMISSLLILLVQVFVLATIIVESSQISCNHDSGCRAGMYCEPSYSLYGGRSSPTCKDCASPEKHMEDLYEYIAQEYNLSGVDEFLQEYHPSEWFLDYIEDTERAVAYCNTTDTMPTRCDHLVESRQLLTGSSFLTLLFAALVAVQPLVRDLEQAADEAAVMHARGGGGVARIFYCINTVRIYGIPLVTVGATSALMLSGDLTAQNFLLDGLTVTFAASFDDLLMYFFISPEMRHQVEIIVNETLEQREGRDAWKRHRLISAILGVTLVLTVLYCEDLETITRPMNPFFTGPCDEVQVIATYLPFLVVVTWAPVMAFFNDRNKSKREIVQDT
eukprot:CAMPEP_0197571538 /NCGR_PEP_ID=MMETSP1320-20131121/42008_1 /TAXON_ID=91990 /ORGANISM="Bolidomonas sp., Strain RCC2347" /LENGTH=537 /DNA_ID=CAMNT_0043134031 /DNA_START=74 /DNA_END=1684 /DNA_ORIENTATION=-